MNSLMDLDFQRTPGCLIRYKVGEKTMIHSFDGPHIVKVVRNNLLTKNVQHYIDGRWDVSKSKKYGNKQLASWDDVTKIFEINRTGCFLRKITEDHIMPSKKKMTVSVATQILSSTYGTVMKRCAERNLIRKESLGTADYLMFVNDYFDSINGSGPVEKRGLKGSINNKSNHFAFWEWALLMLSTMKHVDKKTGKTNNRSTVFQRMMSTIRGYQEVIKICFSEKIEEVALRYV